MRAGISISVSATDRRRLVTLIRDRNAAQKHVWRAEIVLLTSEGVGTNEIMRRTGKSKTCVWRWQERFLDEGFEGLLRDKGGVTWAPAFDVQTKSLGSIYSRDKKKKPAEAGRLSL